MIEVLAIGPASSLQGPPRRGVRHFGVPPGGDSDPLSAALARHLVGNSASDPVIEITLLGGRFRFHNPTTIAITGADGNMHLNGSPIPHHETIEISGGSILDIAPPSAGLRTYLAFAGTLTADKVFGSVSTYMPARFGGHGGRALTVGDKLEISDIVRVARRCTPLGLRPMMQRSWWLRALPGAEFDALAPAAQSDLFKATFQVSAQLGRMGGALEGPQLLLRSDGRLPSAAVFPGTLQCPPSGVPYLLMADAQTTGGYPRIAQIIAADRHMLGQIRPGDKIQFGRTDIQTARDVLHRKTALFMDWLGPCFSLSS